MSTLNEKAFSLNEVTIPNKAYIEGDTTASSKKTIQFEDLYSRTFRPRTPDWTWVETDTGDDGVYTTINSTTGDIWIRYAGNLWGNKATKDRVLINRSIIDNQELDHPFTKYHISPDLKYIAVASQVEKVWRHSYTARYRIFDLQDPSKEPVVVAPKISRNSTERYIALFQWSAKGHDVSFVVQNNVYVLIDNLTKVRQVSTDGSTNIINGIPDWVYEEEVYASNSAMWWSPDGHFLAYLKFDDSPIPEITVPLYSNGAILSHANMLAPSNTPSTAPLPNDPKNDEIFFAAYADYPQNVNIKYPKAGHHNPRVSLHVYRIAGEVTTSVKYDFKAFDESMVEAMKAQSEDRIICDVVWGSSKDMLVRFTNKEQNLVATALCSIDSPGSALTANVVRLEPGGYDFKAPSKEGDGGWYQTDSHPIIPLHQLKSNPTGYIDRVVVDGFYHLVLFETLNATTPSVFLTSGAYDIEKALGLNYAKEQLYYASRQLDSTASHIYSVHIYNKNKNHVSDESSVVLNEFNDHDNDLGHFDADLSPGGGFMVLSYLGPRVPYHTLVRDGDAHKALILEKNARLRKTLSLYDIPKLKFTRITVNNTLLNAMELKPPTKSKDKLRVLFRCYGGPESQMVTRNFNIDFHYWLVSNLTDVAVVTVDGHGTGFKGRNFAVGITKNLGKLEAQDQLGAIAAYSTHKWVDPSHLGLWGWSFGGYLTAKVVEADNNHLLSAAISVAPVSDWRFYDSIYTERYMNTPQNNPEGYKESAVNKVKNFNATNYLLMHGAADDNVHIQNSFRLTDLFNQRDITRTSFYLFPDNDHSISAYHSNWALYKRLYEHVRDKL
ncbi:Dipeptidyl peptidase 4, variant 2 [Entomophthora muscae]|nr:Dipeptidyl peptidase 4, variant 2 [Entomophthora muscae]